jgi:hypothetical protein
MLLKTYILDLVSSNVPKDETRIALWFVYTEQDGAALTH